MADMTTLYNKHVAALVFFLFVVIPHVSINILKDCFLISNKYEQIGVGPFYLMMYLSQQS